MIKVLFAFLKTKYMNLGSLPKTKSRITDLEEPIYKSNKELQNSALRTGASGYGSRDTLCIS